MPIPTPATAQRIIQLLDRRSEIEKQRNAGGGSRGRIPVLVLCDSDTAATESGIGAQCYSATVLDINANDTAVTIGAEVWLTVLGSTGTPVVPTVDKPYFGLLAGEAVPDGTGSGRLRVYAVEDEGTALTVKESDGSPSYTGITSLEFDEASFTVTQPAAGRAKIEAMSGGGGSPNFTGNVELNNLNMTSTAGDNPSTWYDLSAEFVVPPGTYHFTSTFYADIIAQSTVATKGINIAVELYNVTASTFVQRGAGGSNFPPAGIGDIRIIDVGGLDVIFAVDVLTTLKLRAQSNITGSSGTLSVGALRLVGTIASFHQISDPYFSL